MNKTSPQSGLSLESQRRYRDNFARHILSITLYIQSEIMNALTLRHGHSQLRLNFEPYIALAGGNGARLSEIAEVLGVSRQAANQTANQIEAAGYLQRSPDPSDGRAKLITQTARARTLVKQGTRQAAIVQARFSDIVGAETMTDASLTLARLSKQLGLLFPAQKTGELVLAGILPRLADYVSSRLQTLTIARGHPGLKRSFASVLMSIGPSGGRIQHIADAQDVSKQAISAIVTELEDLHYIERQSDPDDARQLILLFTDSGRQLIADSIISTENLYQEFAAIVGRDELASAVNTLARIYRALKLGDDIFGQAESDDLGLIARQLTRQLGGEGIRALATLILSEYPDKYPEVAL